MPQKNDIGVVVELTITKESDGSALDISAASTRQIILTPPSGTVITKTATLSGAGTDGKMRYTTESGVLSELGSWEVQGRVVIGAVDLRTSIAKMVVKRNL